MKAAVLVINCGSSSIRFALFDATARPVPREPFLRGKVDAISGGHAVMVVGSDAPQPLAQRSVRPCHDAHDALEAIRLRVTKAAADGGWHVALAAHRVVHGGARHFSALRLDARSLAELVELVPLAPLHQPFALEAVQLLLEADPALVQVASFDTGFHHTMPVVEQMLALPYRFWEQGVRRYGFHGLSYEFMSLALPEKHGAPACGRMVVAHLGSGASLCAMQAQRSVATTMGFSALDGLMMGTRCGSIDAGAVLHLIETEALASDGLARLLYHESGLLGVSGVSADPRDLLEREAGDARCALALALYVRRIVREIGGLVAVLGGLDLLAFTGGIGEHNATIRARVCAALGYLGVQLDAEANHRHASRISTPGSSVLVACEPTNEEWIAARDAVALADVR